MRPPFLHAAALGGEDGVMHALQLLQNEVDSDLALLGVNDITRLAGADVAIHGRVASSDALNKE